jgi:hypothetical protein
LPTFVTCVPNSETTNDNWKIVIGFEGFSPTVSYQLEKCTVILKEHGLKESVTTEYNIHKGVFGEVYEQMSKEPFILRSDLLLNKAADFIKFLNEELSISHCLLDSGNGRVYASFSILSDEQWNKICDLASRHDGHVILERAPDDFKKHNDVFGLSNPSWSVMHQIKAQLDTNNLFSVGHLPGKI